MPQIILAINAGSSSLKITIFKTDDGKKSGEVVQLATAEMAGLSDSTKKFTYKRTGKEERKQDLRDIQSHRIAFQYIWKYFQTVDDLHEVTSKDDITHVCHRVVHGGDYKEAVVINQEAFHHIEALEDLAPLYDSDVSN